MPLPQLIEPNVLATIVVSKIPASLDNPLKRNKFTGHECVSSVKARKDQLIVHLDKSAVNDFCYSIKNTVASCASKFVTQKILGIAKGILLDFVVDQFCREPGIASASRLGASTVVKIEFTDLLSKARLLKTRLKIGYELIRVSDPT